MSTYAAPYSARTSRRARTAARTAPSGVVPMAVPAFLLLSTLAYLVVELPFATRLVDVLGGVTHAGTVHALERSGRYVSGAALALAAWGLILPRLMRKRVGTLGIGVRLALVAAACMVVMSHGQRTLVDAIADSSKPAERQGAMRAVVARDALAGGILPHGVAASEADALDTRWKATVAAVPFLNRQDPDVLRRFPADPSTLAHAYARSGFPSASSLKREAYDVAMASLKSGFPAYVQGSKRYMSAVSGLRESAERAWDQYLAKVPRNALAMAGNEDVRGRIIRDVRGEGVNVPSTWDPRDRAGFQSAYVKGVVDHADASYKTAAEAGLGKGPLPPPGITRYEDFVAHPAIQDRLKRALGLPAGARAVLPGLTEAAFTTVHAAAREESARVLGSSLSGSPAAYADGNALAEAGKDAVRLSVAPMLGLVLSALGAIGHLAKAAHYAGALAFPRVSSTWRGAALAAGLALAVGSIGLQGASHLQGPSGPATAIASWSAGAHAAISPLGRALSHSPAYVALSSVSPGLSAP